MKLAAKLILIFLAGVFGIVMLFTWQTVRRQHAWEQQRRQAHAADLAETLAPAIQRAYEQGGTVTVHRAIEVSTRRLSGPQVRWIDGADTASSAPADQLQTTSRQLSSVSITDRDGDRKAFSYVPMTLDNDAVGTVEVAEPLAGQDAFVRESVMTSLWSLLGVAVLSAVVIYCGGVQLVGKPLNKLITQVNQIGDGQLDQPPVLSSNDELGRLAGAVSQMSYRISQQRDTIRHADRLGTIGTLAAGMAHELGTPLNVVSGRAGLIASGKLSAAEIQSSAQTIRSEAERMTTIIRQLLDFARQTPAPHESISLDQVVQRTCDLIRPIAGKSGVDLQLQLPDQVVQIDGDAAQIQQVVTNLMNNAIAAMPDGGTLTVQLDRHDDQDQIMLRVSDTGQGIPAEHLDQVFEPFFTTKDVGQGTGLGLSIAYGIVRDHGGQIRVQSQPEQGQPEQGTTFEVTFPIPK
ncbi:HAMP domain-containing histidine kinase [Stieleria sp. TO1_6]|uniref:sensor histidine kinase n=1 Tax=Stieleria tagensis TaxID=2956795 RepID=UPI00209A95C2|nr:HAMP domain-containing sensor histidine kinase [Stieleria tagensis]MCO8120831.1 HAMP domain-containing histidine kinase [Stieleria tagensis]